MMVGDYNLPHVKFSTDSGSSLCEGNMNARSEITFNCFSNYSIHQLIGSCNIHRKMLELLFSSSNLLTDTDTSHLIVPPDNYRPRLLHVLISPCIHK